MKLVDLQLNTATIQINPEQVVSLEQNPFQYKYSDEVLPPGAYHTVITLSTGKQIKLHRPIADVIALLGAGS